jgi:hypothetical protein
MFFSNINELMPVYVFYIMFMQTYYENSRPLGRTNVDLLCFPVYLVYAI